MIARLAAAFAAVSFVVVLLPAPAGGLDLTDIEKRGALRVLAVPGSEQFFSLDGGGAPGFDREILEGFAQGSERCDFEPVSVASWDALVPALAEGRGDLAAGGITATDARRRAVDCASEVFPSRMVAMTRKPTPPVATVAQLRALKVGATRGTACGDAGRARTRVPPAAALRAGRVAVAIVWAHGLVDSASRHWSGGSGGRLPGAPTCAAEGPAWVPGPPRPSGATAHSRAVSRRQTSGRCRRRR